jgi:uncharacterized protein (DUF2236 family)
VARPSEGLFGPTSTVWRVERELAVLVGGGSRALLMQVAHPKIAAAVLEHSRFRSDPLGRLRDTLDAAYAFTFGETERARQAVGSVNRIHAHVRGTTPDGEPYSALDPHLLLWVYATLMDTSLVAYETFVAPLSEEARERYYVEGRDAGRIWGIPPGEFPATLADLRAWMTEMIDTGEVAVSDQGREVGRAILHPPLWWLPPPVTLPMELLTIWLLPPALRAGFGCTWGPRREAAMRRVAALSRVVVPHLPSLARELPVARAARHRVA